jgi:hypothetical protein
MVDRRRRPNAKHDRRNLLRKGPLSAGVLAASLGAMVLAPAGGAEEAKSDPEDRWRPSASISIQVNQQRGEASIESTLATDTISNNDPTPIPLSSDIHDDYFVPVIPFELQLESPAFDLPFLKDFMKGGPRVFVQGSYQYVPIHSRDFLVDGKFVPIPPPPSAQSQGLGGRIQVDLQHQWSASIGLSFPFEVFETPIVFRPSVSYLGQWVKADSRVIGVQIGTNTLIQLDSDDSDAVHYVGPRVSLEADAGRTGDARFAFFLESGFYYSRAGGNQSLEGEAMALGETSSFRYEPDAWLYQVGAGFRVYWDPIRR